MGEAHLDVQMVEGRGFNLSNGRYYVKLGWPLSGRTAKTSKVKHTVTAPKWSQHFVVRLSTVQLARGLLLRVFVKRRMTKLCVAYGLIENLSDLVINQGTLVWCPLQASADIAADAAILLRLRAVDFGRLTIQQRTTSYFGPAPSLPPITIEEQPASAVEENMPSNEVDEGSDECAVAPPQVTSRRLQRQASAIMRSSSTVSADGATVLPRVMRSIADEVYAYKQHACAIRSERRKKKMIKYGKRAAVVTGVVAVGAIGVLSGVGIGLLV